MFYFTCGACNRPAKVVFLTTRRMDLDWPDTILTRCHLHTEFKNTRDAQNIALWVVP